MNLRVNPTKRVKTADGRYCPAVVSGNETESKGRDLTTAIAEFIKETRLTKKEKTLYAYTKATEYFAESCRKRNLKDIERIDMRRDENC